MSTLQERYASGEFDQEINKPEISAAELQTKENHRLAKAAWLDLPMTKEMLVAAANLQQLYLDRAMELSTCTDDSSVIRVLVGKAEAVKTLITEIIK